MSFTEKRDLKKYHKRIIEVSTYEYDEERFITEGCLTDQRFQTYYPVTGEERPPGIIHHMTIRLLFKKTNLEIEDVSVEMPVVPEDVCLETINSLKSVKGLRIARGFTSKVKSLAGGGQGCNHLVALLISMGSSAVQGYAAYYEQKTGDAEWALNNPPIDTCWTWRANGHLMNLVKEKTG